VQNGARDSGKKARRFVPPPRDFDLPFPSSSSFSFLRRLFPRLLLDLETSAETAHIDVVLSHLRKPPRAAVRRFNWNLGNREAAE